MEILELLKNLGLSLEKLPPGLAGVFLVACVALIYIGQALRRDKQESKLVSQLQASLEKAREVAKEERERADGIHGQLLELSLSSARNGALLEGMERQLAREAMEKEQLRAKVETLESAVERLVEEIRNKDHSIAELVRLNRQLLSSLPPAPVYPALPPAAQG